MSIGERRNEPPGRRVDDGMTDDQFHYFVKSLKAAFSAAVTDAIAEGRLVAPERINAMEDAIYGHVDPISGEREGGLHADMRSLVRKQNVSLSMQTILLLVIPVIVAIITSQP